MTLLGSTIPFMLGVLIKEMTHPFEFLFHDVEENNLFIDLDERRDPYF